MGSVFVFARLYLGIDAGWSFATGARTGLVKDSLSIHLAPHYWLGVFFVLAHLAAGARAVTIAHGVGKTFADRFMIVGAIVAGMLAGRSYSACTGCAAGSSEPPRLSSGSRGDWRQLNARSVRSIAVRRSEFTAIF
jgi:hypothetical protein